MRHRQPPELGVNSITEGVIWKQLLLFFFPILLGTFFQQLYNTVDAVIVGKFVGKEALAAVGGATGVLINLLVGFFVGVSSGAAVVISQYFGAQKHEDTAHAVHTSVAISLVGGVLFMVLGLWLSPLALRLMGTPPEVIGYALTYIRVYFVGIIFSLFYNIGSAILRAVGDSRRPLYFLIVCSLANLVLDLIFVAGMGMGVLGAALATVISQAISAVLVYASLRKADLSYQLIPREVRFHGAILRNIARIGVPAGLQSVMYSVSNIIIQSSINAFGTDSVAAWTAYGKIDGLFWMIMSAFGVAITTFSGQNFGAQKYGRIRKSVRVCLGMAMATAVILSVVLFFAGHYVFRLFTNDAAVIAKGVEILGLLTPFYFTYVCVEVLSGAVRGTGDSIVPMTMTCLGICILRVVWIFTVVPHYSSLRTVVVSYPITWAATSLLFILYYLQGGWLRRCITKAGFVPPEPSRRFGFVKCDE